jgi:homoserine kinase
VTEQRLAATAFAPASVSNVACGFDIMGFALDGLGHTVTVRYGSRPGVHIARAEGGGSPLPRDPLANTAGPPVIRLAELCGVTRGLEIEIRQGFVAGSGLGASAASAVAAAVACNALFGAGLSRHDLLTYALEGERVASGALHADNVAPSLFGGFVLIRGYDPVDIVQLATPAELVCAIVHPQMEIATRESRRLLPSAVPLRNLVTQTGNAAGLVAGLLTGDYQLIGRSLRDVVAEPARAHTIPGFTEAQRAAREAGALGCSISGSGPALFALARTTATADRVAQAMGDVYRERNIACTTHVSPVNPLGALLRDEEA